MESSASSIMEYRIRILRYNQEEDKEPQFVSYKVPENARATVLDALIGIYTEIDSTLAFRFSCRYQKCGLCSGMVDGCAKCLCMVSLKDGMELRPLAGLPVLRDLVIERRFILDFLSRYQVYIPERKVSKSPENLIANQTYHHLCGCKECLCCLSHCPRYSFKSAPFSGPYFFVKLAQLHFDPRDGIDRTAQTKTLGISQCADCRKCYCPFGIKIYQSAIQPLLCP